MNKTEDFIKSFKKEIKLKEDKKQNNKLFSFRIKKTTKEELKTKRTIRIALSIILSFLVFGILFGMIATRAYIDSYTPTSIEKLTELNDSFQGIPQYSVYLNQFNLVIELYKQEQTIYIVGSILISILVIFIVYLLYSTRKLKENKK